MNKKSTTITINVDEAILDRLNREGQRTELLNELSRVLKRIKGAGFYLEVRYAPETWEESRRKNLFSDCISIPAEVFAKTETVAGAEAF